MTDTKICKSCGVPTQMTSFPLRSKKDWVATPDGIEKRSGICRKCQRKRRMKSGLCSCGKALVTATRCQTCVDRHSRSSARLRLKQKTTAIDHYGGKCVYCGEACLVFLSIDHKYNDGTKHRMDMRPNETNLAKRRTGTPMYQWLHKHNYPDNLGLQVACFNCNAAKAIVGEEELLRIRAEELTIRVPLP